MPAFACFLLGASLYGSQPARVRKVFTLVPCGIFVSFHKLAICYQTLEIPEENVAAGITKSQNRVLIWYKMQFETHKELRAAIGSGELE
jgi:hypothetical protein